MTTTTTTTTTNPTEEVTMSQPTTTTTIPEETEHRLMSLADTFRHANDDPSSAYGKSAIMRIAQELCSVCRHFGASESEIDRVFGEFDRRAGLTKGGN